MHGMMDCQIKKQFKSISSLRRSEIESGPPSMRYATAGDALDGRGDGADDDETMDKKSVPK